MDSITMIEELTHELNEASQAYYFGGTSSLSDAEFDSKLEKLAELEKLHNFRLSNSPTINVGAPVLSVLNKKSVGERPMLSLDKCRKAEDIVKFAKGKEMIASVKADGLSVRLTYKDGQLISAVTRGNGYEGTDVTEHVKQFLNIPLVVGTENLIIDGEAIIKASDFAIVNKDGQFKNPRNTAAGALNLLDTSEVKARRLSFVAWDVIESEWAYYSDRRYCALQLGFEWVPSTDTLDEEYDEVAIANINEKVFEWAEEAGIPCDGVVWKFNDLEYGESLGRTEKFFRNAIAYKPKDEEAETQLENIEWTMGRQGILTPVAVFKPVELLGSVCSRASLHNLDVMKEILIRPYYGQPVIIVKAQQIIPQIVEAYYPYEDEKYNVIGDGDLHFEIPTLCPYCGEPTEIQSTELTHNLVCTNPACSGKLNNIIEHYCGKKGLDIKHISGKIIGQLMDFGWLNKLSDLYTLAEHREEWMKKSGWGQKSVDRILESIEGSKHCKLANFLSAIGIPQYGPAQTKEIVKVCTSYDDFRSKVNEKWDFTTIAGIGVERWLNIINFDYTQADKIAEMIIFEDDIPIVADENDNTSLDGLTFVITGKMSAPFKKRDELVEYITGRGGKVSSSVSSKTNYLINNDVSSTSAKNKKAIELNIPIISVEEFMTLSQS